MLRPLHEKYLAIWLSVLTGSREANKVSQMATFPAGIHGVFAALSDPTRLAVVERLLDGPLSVSALAEPFDIAGPSFLKHLKVLEGAGVVTSEKKGRVRTVSLAPESLQSVDVWLNRHRHQWEQRLDNLGTYLEHEKKKK